MDRKLDLIEFRVAIPARLPPADNEDNPMSNVLDPFRFLLVAVAGWMNQRQLQMIDYLREENRVLREQLGGRRLRLNDGFCCKWRRVSEDRGDGRPGICYAAIPSRA